MREKPPHQESPFVNTGIKSTMLQSVNFNAERVKLWCGGKLFLFFQKNIVSILVGVILAVAYLPYLLHGGFILDDWGWIEGIFKHPGLFDNFVSYFPLMAYRPLSPVFTSLFANLFGNWAPGYIAANLFFWLGAIFILAGIMKRHFGTLFATIFILAAAVPIVSSSVIFSPVALMVLSGASILLWVVSFYFLNKYVDEKKTLFLALNYIFMFLAFLVYEIVLPLLALSVFFPMFLERSSWHSEKTYFSYWFKRYFAPVAGVLFAVLAYQKIILPLFTVSYSRFGAQLSVKFLINALGSGVSWFFALFVDSFRLMFSSLSYLGFSIFSRLDIWIIAMVLFVIFFKLRRMKTASTKSDGWWLLIVFLTVFSAASFYMLSGATATISGYNNRVLGSSWIGFSLLLAFVGERTLKSKFWWLVPVFIFLIYATFLTQRDGYINSNRLQRIIFSDVIQKMNLIGAENGAIVLGNVPAYNQKNFNNEEIFVVPWDFGAGLDVLSGGRIAYGSPFSIRKIRDGQIKITEDSVLVDDWWRVGAESFNKLYYYEYDETTGKSDLWKIASANDLRAAVARVESANLNNAPVASYDSYAVLKSQLKKFLLRIGIRKFWDGN